MSSNEFLTKYKLSEIAKFKYGKYIPKKELYEEGYPFYNGYGIVGFLPDYKFKEEQLVIVCRGVGGTGDVKISPPKCTIANLSIIITPDESVVAKHFLYWKLKDSDTYSLRTGSAQPQIVIRDLNDFVIKIPPLKEQKTIVDILSSINNKIKLNHQMNKTLEEIAQSIYKNWFVDFEPWQDKINLDGLPHGWNRSSISDLIELTYGNSPKSSTYNEKGVGLPLLTGAGDFTNGLPDATRYSSKPNKVANSGEILLCTRGTIGNVSFADKDYCIGRGVSSMNVKEEKYTEYVYLTLKYYLDFLIHQSTGSVFKNLKKADMLNIPITKCPDNIIDEFHKIMKPILKKQLILIEENKVLVSIRDILLPKLMSGEIRVPTEK